MLLHSTAPHLLIWEIRITVSASLAAERSQWDNKCKVIVVVSGIYWSLRNILKSY